MAEKLPLIALSPTMNEGTIVSWNKKEGDAVAVGDVLCVVETDKAAMDYESQSAGTLRKILVPEGGQAKVADTIAILGSKDEDISALLAATPAPPPPAAVPPPPTSPAAAAPTARPATTGRVRASPLARRLAAARGIDIATVVGSGPGGRVVQRDLEAAASPAAGPAQSAPAQSATTAAPSVDKLIPVTGKRKVIAQRLAESASTAPHFSLTVSVEMDGLLAARARLNESRQAKVSFNAFMHKLAAEALERHPQVNASWQGDSIRRFAHVDIGLAVALPDGLITPVVRHCESKGILAIDAELVELVRKAREGKLALEEYSGATFTITNLGSFGIEEFTAIVNPPGAAILALGEARKVPVVDAEGRIVARTVMRATLTCDHRVIDGAVGAAYLAELKGMVENPFAVLL
jgi:pyruvate dehydrogenase E2 component (dihydrolipoamide acetyltransferase)